MLHEKEKDNITHDFFNTPNTPNRIIHGDSLAVLKTMEDNSVDSIVADPPAGISFMNKSFDSDRGGRTEWIAWLRDIMTEALRVTRPGGHALVWALPRTSHWTMTALEDAGWEIRNNIVHLFGSGFPKSLNVSKAIDKHLGYEREIIGTDCKSTTRTKYNNFKDEVFDITTPSSPQAKQFDGQGSALKPAHEVWILCRKPISENTICENVLRWGVGGLNIDKCRVGTSSSDNSQGKRFPANLLLSHSVFCIPLGEAKVKGSHDGGVPLTYRNKHNIYGYRGESTGQGYTDENGQETIQAYDCVEGCPVLELDRQSGVSKSGSPKGSTPWSKGKGTTGNEGWQRDAHANYKPTDFEGYGDSGTASRYFQTFSHTEEDLDIVPFLYVAKASSRERSKGCEELEHGNNHPTVKNLSLLRYLCTLITPNNGIVLDCFAGSGGTGVACVQSGYNYILIEQEEEYVNICKARLAHAHKTSV